MKTLPNPPAAAGRSLPAPRLVWIGVILAGVAFAVRLVVSNEALQFLVLVLWGLWNLGLCLGALGWSLSRPGRLQGAFRAALGWGLGLAVVLLVVWSSFLKTWMAEAAGLRLGVGALLLAQLLFAPLWAVLTLAGVLGGAVALLAGRDLLAGGAPRAIAIWWTLAIVLAVAANILPLPDDLVLALELGAPSWILLGMRRVAPRIPLAAFSRAAAVIGVLVVPVRLFGRRTSLDLRGPAVGLLAAAIGLAVDASQVLLPLKAMTLVSLSRVRTEPFAENLPSMARFASLGRPEIDDRIVLLRFDPVVEQRMASGGSEAAVQAEMIRRLKSVGAAWIVLPEPLVDAEPNPFPTLQRRYVPDGEVTARTRRDFPALAAAVKEAGNVVLAVSPPFTRQLAEIIEQETGEQPPAPPAASQELRRAARDWGYLGLESFGSLDLPVVDVGEPRALPWVMAGLLAGKRTRPEVVGDTVRVGDRTLPLLPGGRYLVSFLGEGPGRQFRSLTYGAVSRNESVYEPPSRRRQPDRVRVRMAGDTVEFAPEQQRAAIGGGRWIPAAEFLKGRIIFLDTLSARVRETPIGEMPLMEVAATAVAAVVAGRGIAPLAPATRVGLILLLGALTGALCAKRNPLSGGARALLLSLALVVATLSLFLVGPVWLDPVIPILTVVAAYLLSSQLTFRLEQDARERQRGLISRFLAPQVVDQYLEHPEQLRLGGSRRRVCVLFADVRGFTRFAESTAPEEVMRVTNLYLGAMRDALFAHGGFLDKYTGDGLMALFQIDENPEEGVRRAVQAALAMRDAARRVSEQLREEGVPPLGVGIGLHYGEAVVGLVGHEDNPNYTAVGHTVVVSQRLQALAQGGEVIVSDGVVVFPSVRQQFLVEPREPVQVKGLSEPVRPFQVERPALAAGAEG